MKNRFTILAVLAGVLTVTSMVGSSFAGEVSGEKSVKLSKSDVFNADTSVSLFVSDIGIVSDKELAEIKKNMYINVLKADINENMKKANKG